MTGFDDDEGVRRPLSDREADALLRGPELAGLVSDLQAMATQAPQPSPALAAVLAAGIVPDATATAVLPRLVRRRRWLVALPITGAVLGGTLGAASANVLPDGAQRVVSDTVSSITPIRLPKPDEPKPAPEPTARLAPAATAEPSEDPKPSPHPSARPSRPPERDDDGQDQGDSPRPFHTPEPSDEGHGPSSAPSRDEEHHDDGHKGDGGEDQDGSRQQRQATR